MIANVPVYAQSIRTNTTITVREGEHRYAAIRAPMIEAVLFDLDGTLLDREASLRLFIEAQYDRHQDALRQIPKASYVARFVALDARGQVWKDRVYQQLTAALGITGLRWETLLADYTDQFQNHCTPFPHVHATLEQLQQSGRKLGMITNGIGAFQLAAVRALGLEQFFPVLLVSEWEGVKKPDPEIFRRALAKLAVPASNAVFVGDHPDHDVKAARTAGMYAFWKRDPHWPTAVEADAIIGDLSEIPGRIEGLCPRPVD